MRTLVLLRLGFIWFRFSTAKSAAATSTRGSTGLWAKLLLLERSHEGTIVVMTPR